MNWQSSHDNVKVELLCFVVVVVVVVVVVIIIIVIILTVDFVVAL